MPEEESDPNIDKAVVSSYRLLCRLQDPDGLGEVLALRLRTTVRIWVQVPPTNARFSPLMCA
jgi:hypothetical protein